MPRTRPLTAAQVQEERTRKANEVMRRAIKRNRVDTDVEDQELARRVGAGRASIYRWKQDPGLMSLDMARAIARECKISREDWLAIGGYNA